MTKNFHSEDPKGGILNRIGYAFFKEGNLKEAKKIFELNVRLFPEDANVWDSLGEVHFELDEHEKALISYKRALDLDPTMKSAKEMLLRINSTR